MRSARKEPRFPRWLTVAMIMVALAILAAGIWLYKDQNDAARRGIEDDLLAIGRLKTEQIADWRAERLADAAAISANKASVELVARWIDSHRPEDSADIFDWLLAVSNQYSYTNVRLVDIEGAVLLDLTGADPLLAPIALQGLQAALQQETAVLTDLHQGDQGAIHLDAIAPLFSGQGSTKEPLGAVLMTVHADAFLFPLVQTWPSSSRSAETLLVRREGEEVVFLNELRHQQGTALTLRFPLAQTDLAAVKAALGETGIVEGTDYRGETVIAAVGAVPDSPWFVVAKMDKSEAFGGAELRSVLVLLMSILLIAALAAGVGLTWQRSLKKRFVEAYSAEISRQAMLARYEHLVKHANDIILLGDENLRILEANERAVEAYGYSHEELLGLRIGDLVPPEGLGHFQERMAELEEKGSYVKEATHRRKDGSVFPVELSARSFALDGERCYQVLVRDVSERKKAEEERLQLELQFQQSQRLESLGVLAGGIAHDFNNILMAILGYADLACADLPLGSPARDEVKEISRAGMRAAELCRQMLAYSGRGKFVIEPIDLHDLIDGMIHLLSSVSSKKVLLNLNLDKNLPLIMGDASQIDQVVMNLVMNASEAIGERSGVITISTGAMECSRAYLRDTYLDEGLAEGLYVTLEVSDTGMGMSKETQSLVFEPFFTTKITGRGLGLAAVLGIVRGHKGAIKVYSEENRGTTFKLLFPAIESEDIAKKPRSEAGLSWSGSGKILLVDDEETVRVLGRRMLERLGFEVLTASDGLGAVEAYREHGSDLALVLMDLTMPHMDGEEAFRELRRIDPQVRVLISSGYTENDIASRFAGKAVTGFIQKPYTLDRLAQVLQAALGGEDPDRT